MRIVNPIIFFSKKIYVTTMLTIFKLGVKKAIPIIVIRMAWL